MTDRELMQMALDALVLNNKEWEELADQSGRWKAEEQDHYHHTELTINALRDRLAQPEPEPAFYVIQATDRFGEGYEQTYWEDPLGFPVYTRPVHASDISQERVDETAKCGHEPAPNDYDRSIHNNPDAQAWAKFFMATVKEKEWCIDDIDEGLMLGWFANAMMAMHDHVKREHEFECPRCGHCCRGWVGLTDGEMVDLLKECEGRLWSDGFRAIEAKLKEKNT